MKGEHRRNAKVCSASLKGRGTGAGEAATVRRTLLFGWSFLLLYLSLGVALEILHGLKIQYYLNLANVTRRMLWTLAHAHGTLLALLLIIIGLIIGDITSHRSPLRFVARLLAGSAVLLPAGFFFGGVFTIPAAPDTAGLPILLVPLGAVMLLAAVLLAARHYSCQP